MAPELRTANLTTGRYLTLEEAAVQLGWPIYRVRAAIRRLGAQVQWRLAVTPGKRARARLFHESSLPLIEQEITRDEPPKNAAEAKAKASAKLRDLTKNLGLLATEIKQVYRLLQLHPVSESRVLHTLPHPHLQLVRPVTLALVFSKSKWQASLADLSMNAAAASSKEAAVQKFSHLLAATYERIEQNPSSDPPAWVTLQQLIRRLSPQSPPPLAAKQAPPDTNPPPTFDDWKNDNLPARLGRAEARAWTVGAKARFYCDTDCRFRTRALIQAWRRGYATLGEYLKGGGLLSCECCAQVISETASPKSKSPATT